jgi:MmyB-like transcription regulator ligand binding domain
MDMTNDFAEFSTSRRAKASPERAGLPTYGKRRVPGLRREEVASLAGTKRIHHPVVGDLDLSYEALELPAGSGLTMSVYAAEPDSASQEALELPASWTATPV